MLQVCEPESVIKARFLSTPLIDELRPKLEAVMCKGTGDDLWWLRQIVDDQSFGVDMTEEEAEVTRARIVELGA